MAISPYLSTSNLSGVVSDPGQTSLQDGTGATASLAANQALHVQEVAGKFYTAARRGNLFIASTPVAGVTLPVSAATLASTAGMINPTASTKLVELVAIGLTNTTIEVAVKPNVMGFQLNYSSTGGVPTSQTLLTSYGSPIGMAKKSAVASAYSAATMTNVAAPAPVIYAFGGYQSAVGFTTSWFTFDGTIVMAPDTVMAIYNAVTAVAGQQVTYVWSEWPL